LVILVVGLLAAAPFVPTGTLCLRKDCDSPAGAAEHAS
jgi:hypothetical protein